jgi:O-antigen ligase
VVWRGKPKVKIVKSRVQRHATDGSSTHADRIWRGKSPQHVVFYLLLAFLLVCLAGGGSNRADIASLLYLRPLNVIFLVGMLIVPTQWDFRCVRMPLMLLGLLALLILAQLVPLPPSLWASLPGRAPFTEAAIALGGQPWRPISVTPDLTLSSLLALLVPLTVLVGFAGIRSDQRTALIPLTIGAAVLSAVLGIVQFAGGQGAANLYERALNVPNGFFANRNHHAAFLASALVLISTWLRSPAHARWQGRRYWVGGLTAFLLLAVVIATGSRSGTLLALLALGYTAATAVGTSSGTLSARKALLLRVALAVTALLLIGFMLLAGRAVSLNRLFGFDPAGEQRIQAFPTLITMLRDFMPIGSGFGSFDPVFRMYEPDELLHPGYFNHAHNDWLELALTGGLPALLLLATFILWAGWRLYSSFRTPASDPALRVRSGGLVLLVLAGASVSDYPLRTPILAALLALACAWLARSGGEQPAAER